MNFLGRFLIVHDDPFCEIGELLGISIDPRQSMHPATGTSLSPRHGSDRRPGNFRQLLSIMGAAAFVQDTRLDSVSQNRAYLLLYGKRK